ncbi:MAG: VanZ family protein [Hydrogenophaga sp.]|nr:VanZ family protein [Hydrogenophaga sp.]
MKVRSSAWTLALLFTGLILYASLYPFTGWWHQGVAPLAFLWAPWPQYWTAFDLASNLVGYMPLGFLLCIALLRSDGGRYAWPVAALLPALLSLAVETTQNFLPMRIASNVDLALNALGGVLGASLGWMLERIGVLHRWSQIRADWFEPGAHGGLVLLAIWPVALLYPASVPFGLGQVWTRLEAGLIAFFDGTPFLQWVPVGITAPDPLSPLAEAFCIALCLLAPLMMGFGEMRSLPRRLVFLGALMVCAIGMEGISSALTFGPEHAWAWYSAPVGLGMAVALLLGLALAGLPRRVCNVVMLLALAVSLTLLNRTSTSPYFAQSLEVWEQGRFIRFHGLSQWLGWLWPYAALLFGLRMAARRTA